MSRWPFVVPGSPARQLSGWRARLGRDPVPILLREGSPALAARVRRDLISDDEAPGQEEIAGYPEIAALLRKQAKDGSWPARASEKALGPSRFATALATLRILDRLADTGLSGGGPAGTALERGIARLFASQERDGGIADLAVAATSTGRARKPALQFHGWGVAAACRVGFDADPRVEAAFRYLLENRQADGGWAWRGVRTDSPARPSSHLVTGMVLRAFAASSSRRTSREARRAAELLATRFFQPDRYPDRRAPTFWEAVGEPRLYTDILDALDGVTAVGLGKENAGVRTAEAYLRQRQNADGLWYPGPPERRDGKDGRDAKDRDAARWLTLRVLLVLRRVN